MKIMHSIILALSAVGVVWIGFAGAQPSSIIDAPKKQNQSAEPVQAQRTNAGERKQAAVTSPAVATASSEADGLGPVPIESNWRDRGMKWFKSDDLKARRKEMRAVSRALKRPCKYCHTRDFKGFVGHRKITQQMMALSIEHDVACADCHAGRNDFTEMGKRSQLMWKISHERKVFCDHCHIKKKRFNGLTPEGQAFKDEGSKK